MITIDKAIEILELNVQEAGKKMPADTLEALKLAIEAVKVVKAIRPYSNSNKSYYLPGEDPPEDSKRSLHHIKKVLESPLGREPGS